MKIRIEKAILASTLLALVFTAVFAFQFISFAPQGAEILSPGIFLPLILFWIFGIIAVLLSLYDILSSKNEVPWKIGWSAAIFIMSYLGVFVYLFIGRKNRLQ